ncbi:GLPGLI family protein [uncultured Aquimarina sp.]|uniref:GLPGLI family protein n=1 Tax=uncultured Aquimarina sp. TaxID=575652 RepID=UPI002639BB96|nr:GLPGLI family protein [uncultured Aquimarina sp.]
MKTLSHIFIILFFSIYYSFGQTYQIEYKRIKHNEFDGGKNRICPTTLYTNTQKSIFLENRVINGRSTEVKEEDYQNGERSGNEVKGDSLGKLIIKNTITQSFQQKTWGANYKKNVYYKVKDSILPKFDWQITGEQKEILGYTVQKASSTYKNRTIAAWFTNDFAISDGPWKFYGLPGLILEAHIEFDSANRTSMVYQAILIKQIPSLPEIEISKNIPLATIEQLEKDHIDKYRRIFKFYETKSKGEIRTRYDDLDFEPIIFSTN